MDNDFQNYELPQPNLNSSTEQYDLLTMNAQGLAFEIIPNIEIIPGYRYNNTPLSWLVNIDQHALRFYISEQVSTTGVVQYLLKLVGPLYYNVSFLGLEPIDAVSDDDGPIAFSSNGSYMIDYVVGVFNNIADIQNIILSKFSISSVVGQVGVVGKNNQMILFDPTNPQPFYDAIKGDQSITVRINLTVLIQFGDKTIS